MNTNGKQRSYAYKEYVKTIQLLSKGFKPIEVSRELGIPESTLLDWRSGKHKPPSVRWAPDPSSELAYIIGVLNGGWCIVREHTGH